MKLYVANPTRQNAEVHYRLDFNAEGAPEPNARFQPAKKQTIAPGRQVALGGDLKHMSQVNDIVEQLERFGMIAVKEVGTQKKFAPYIFNVDQPVPAEVIRRVAAQNQGVLIVEGRDRRRRAAIVANQAVEQAVAAEAAAVGQAAPEQTAPTEVEFEQLEATEAGETMIGEGFRIDRDAPPGVSPGKGGGRGPKAKRK